MRTFTYILLAAALCGAAIAQTPNYRLSRNVLPSNYDLTLTPYFNSQLPGQQFTFDAFARVTLSTILPNENQIVLHAQNLTIKGISLREVGSQVPININSQAVDETTNKLTLVLASVLRSNTNYALEFTYSGILFSDMHGFYRSSYVEDGITR